MSSVSRKLANQHSSWEHSAPGAMARGLFQLVDICLLGVVFLAPLFMGGRHPVGLLVYVCLVCAASLAWAAAQCLSPRRYWRWSGMELLLAAGFLLILFQITPLPASLVERLSPAVAELLPLWTASAEPGLGSWNQLSLAPESTRGALVVFTAHAMLFLVVVQRVNEIEDIERLFRWLALAGVLMACLGIAQLLLSNGKFLWVYQHPFRDTLTRVKGPFSNENHFCQLLALCIGPLIWWLQHLESQSSSTHDRKRPARRGFEFGRSSRGHDPRTSEQTRFVKFGLLLGLGAIALAGLLTTSRGGIVVMFLAAATTVLMLACKSLLGRRAVATLSAVGVCVAIAICMYGYQPLMDQLGTMNSVEGLDRNSVRQKLWAADLKAASDFPLLGVGGGGHVDIYPTYFEHYSAVRFTHAESGYIQVLAEGGALGIALLALAMIVIGTWCISMLRKSTTPRVSAIAAVVTASLLVSAVHSIWDFVWYIPACMSLAVIMVACCCRARQLQRTANPQTTHHAEPRTVMASPSPLIWGATSAVLLGLMCMMISNRLPPAKASLAWDSYLALTRVDAVAEYSLPDDPATELETLRARLDLLGATLAANPRDAGANLAMASHLLRYFNAAQMESDNAMWFTQIKQAAMAGGFASPQEQRDWLRRVCGPRFRYLLAAETYAKRCVHCCPLHGEAYIYLGELAFLNNVTPSGESAFVEQALRVRPFRGAVLLAAGKQAAAGGEVKQSLEYWKRAFHQDPNIQQQIISLLAPHVTAQFFLVEFQPDELGLATLYNQYLQQEMPDQAREIAGPYAERLSERARNSTDRNALRAWNEASRVYAFLNDEAQQLECLRCGLAAAPGEYKQHYVYGVELLRQQQFEQAIEQFRWCRARKPDDPLIEQKLTEAVRQQQLFPTATMSESARAAATPAATGFR